MMGHGHASSGLCTGLAVGDALAWTPGGVIALGLSFAGACVLPDIDCQGSTAASVFGPFSEAVHHGAIELHNMVSASISTEGQPHGAHRGLTHWWPFWIVCGAGVEIGCLWSRWFVMGVLAVLFALAARGLTIPDLPAETQGRFEDSLRHQWMMQIARGLLNLNPFTLLMRYGRKYVDKKRRYGWKYVGVRFGIGKVTTAAAALGLAYYLTTDGLATQLGPWLGLIVGVGMGVHWMGDSPTHMGVPGIKLHQVWKLPRWASFYAGGPFEIMAIWFTMGWLNIALIPGLMTHAHQMTVVFWVGLGLAAFVILAVIIEATQAKRRRYTS